MVDLSNICTIIMNLLDISEEIGVWINFNMGNIVYSDLNNSWKRAYIESLIDFLTKINSTDINQRNSDFKFTIDDEEYEGNNVSWDNKIKSIISDIIWKEKIDFMNVLNLLSESIVFLQEEYDKLRSDTNWKLFQNFK